MLDGRGTRAGSDDAEPPGGGRRRSGATARRARGTSISAVVTEPCRLTSSKGPVSVGSSKAMGSRATRATSPRRPAAAGVTDRAEPALVEELLDAAPPRPGRRGPRWPPRAGRRRVPGTACSHRNRPSPDCRATRAATDGREADDVVADVDLAVVGRDHERRAGGQVLEHAGHEAIGGHELGVVELAEAVLVGHLVDAVVVGVDEPLAEREVAARPRRRASTASASRGGGPPARWASVKPVPANSALVIDGHVGAEERRERLQLAGRHPPAGVARRRRPAQHVQHLAPHLDAVARRRRARPATARWRSR